MILEWCVMGCSRTSSGPLWSRYCRPPRVVRDARGQIIDGRWRASRGGIARVHRGGTYRSSSARGRPCGNAISADFGWSQDGTYQRIFDAVRLAGLIRQSVDPDLEQLLSADSTVVRAHHTPVGAPIL